MLTFSTISARLLAHQWRALSATYSCGWATALFTHPRHKYMVKLSKQDGHFEIYTSIKR